MTRDFDAIVIGAGPAGSMAAWEFAGAGWRVLLLDRHHFPRHKACGGAMGTRALRALPFSIDAVIHNRVAWQLSNERTHSEVFELAAANNVVVTSRWDFDAFLVGKAVARGAVLRAGERVLRVREGPDGVTVVSAQGEYRAMCAVLAIGAGLQLDAEGVIRAAGSPQAFAIEGTLIADGDRSTRVAPEFISFDYRKPEHGYTWVFPAGDHLNVGIGTFVAGSDVVNRALLQSQLEVLQRDIGGRWEAVRGAPLGVGGLGYAPSGRIFRAGDAAGFTSESTGEGIAPALISGRWAAQACIESIRQRLDAGFLYGKSLRPLYRWLREQRNDGVTLYGA